MVVRLPSEARDISRLRKVQTGPEPSKMALSKGVKRRGVGLTVHIHPVQSLEYVEKHLHSPNVNFILYILRL